MSEEKSKRERRKRQEEYEEEVYRLWRDGKKKHPKVLLFLLQYSYVYRSIRYSSFIRTLGYMRKSFLTTFGFSDRRKTMKKAPGYGVLKAAEFLCSPKTIDQVFEPLVSDWQEEYFAALNQNRWSKARWISIRYMWKALLAFGLSKLFAAVRAFSTKR